MKKIAIIDSGIDATDLPFNTTLVSSIKILSKRKDECIEILIDDSDDNDDYHGTSVLYSIRRYSGNINLECYSFNVFDNNKASSYSVLEALRMCLEIDELDAIVMSIAFDTPLKKQFERMFEKLYTKTAIFCSVRNNEEVSYPASSKFVIGVKAGNIKTNGKYIYNKNDNIQVITNSEYEFFQTTNGKLLRFRGNSKSNGVIAGLALKNMENYEEEILTTNVEDSDFFKEKEKEGEIPKEFINAVRSEFNRKVFFIDTNKLDKKWYLSEELLIKIKRFIEMYMGKLEYFDLNYYNICNFTRLAEYIYENRKKVFNECI